MFAIDTNILVYAHNADSPFNNQAVAFVERIMNRRDENGELPVCIPSQVITEFINVVTRQSVTRPLALEDAVSVVCDYINTGVRILHQKDSQILTLLALLGKTTTRKKVFDIALVATLKDNGIEGLYTVNTKDFKEFKFLTVQNPIE